MELVPFHVARALAEGAASPGGVDEVPLDRACGRVAASPAAADDDLVPFARSAMDGYAVRARDARAGRPLRVAASVVAGDEPAVHRRATATAIATGAALPLGADAVIPWEYVTRVADAIVPHVDGVPGSHLFPPADDARRGDVLVAAGEVITPGMAALLAAAGYATVRVVRRPRVRIVTTGDELVAVDARPRPGQVRDSNGPLLCALAAAEGADVVPPLRVGDDAGALAAALRTARAGDVVITTGGASAGPRDFVKGTLDAMGATFAFRSVALRPAKPTALARYGDVVVAVLPGNPSAAFVAYHLIVAPLIAAASGRGASAAITAADLDGELRAKADRTYAAHAAVRCEHGHLVARVLDNQCSSLVGNAARANALVLLPPGARTYTRGELVDVALVAPVESSREACGALRLPLGAPPRRHQHRLPAR